MKIEVRNVKHSAFASEETLCFEATVYIDGKRAGTAHNQGHGGATEFDPHECEARLDAYAKTLPLVVTTLPDESDPSGFLTYAPTGDSLVSELVHQVLVGRDVKRLLSRRIVYTVAGKADLFHTLPRKGTSLASTLTDARLLQTLKAETILNLLPLSEAIALYKDRMRLGGSKG